MQREEDRLTRAAPRETKALRDKPVVPDEPGKTAGNDLFSMVRSLQRSIGNRATSDLLGHAARRGNLHSQVGGEQILGAIDYARSAHGEQPTRGRREVRGVVREVFVQRGLPVAIEALEVALTATIVAQEQSAIMHGGLTYASEKGSRFGRPPQPTDQEYEATVLDIAWKHPIRPNLYAVFKVHWQGNRYGEMGGAYVQVDLPNTSNFIKSSLDARFTALETMPRKGEDDRLWPMVWIFEGEFDPVGAGDYAFQGKFEINAFGGFTPVSLVVMDEGIGFGSTRPAVNEGKPIAGSSPPPRPAKAKPRPPRKP
jgi:hypothetical protein